MRNLLTFKHYELDLFEPHKVHLEGVCLPFISLCSTTAAQGLWELRTSKVYKVAPLGISGQTGFANACSCQRNKVSGIEIKEIKDMK